MQHSTGWKMLNIAHFQHISQAAGFIGLRPAVFTNSEQK
jgi:hypothetical protein